MYFSCKLMLTILIYSFVFFLEKRSFSVVDVYPRICWLILYRERNIMKHKVWYNFESKKWSQGKCWIFPNIPKKRDKPKSILFRGFQALLFFEVGFFNLVNVLKLKRRPFHSLWNSSTLIRLCRIVDLIVIIFWPIST